MVEPIFRLLRELTAPGSTEEAHRHALWLAPLAFGMPYGNESDLIDTLLSLAQPIAAKLNLLAALVLAGEVIPASIVLHGLRAFLKEGETNTWLLTENNGIAERWLELLPFTDKPGSVLEGLDLLPPNLKTRHRLERVLLALGHSPWPAATDILGQLVQDDNSLLNSYEWLTAADRRDAALPARLFLKKLNETPGLGDHADWDIWRWSKRLAVAMRSDSGIRAQVYEAYKARWQGRFGAILELTMTLEPDEEGILLLVSGYAAHGRRFDGNLRSALRNIALDERPSQAWAGAFDIIAVPASELRAALFAKATGRSTERALAEQCLIAIDELRDEHGVADSEPRHPNIDSGLPWPIIASRVE
jgi:hypothetical protein